MPSVAQTQQALPVQHGAAASMQQPASALDRFNARKSMSIAASRHSSAQTQSGSVQHFRSLRKTPSAFGRVSASQSPEAAVQHASAPIRAAPPTNRVPAGLDHVNAKLEARRKLRVSQSGAAPQRLEKGAVLRSVPSAAAERVAVPSDAVHASYDCHQQSSAAQVNACTSAGLGRMRCDVMVLQQDRMKTGLAGVETGSDAHAALLGNRLRPDDGVESTRLAIAKSDVIGLGHSRMHSDVAQQAKLVLASDRVQPACPNLAAKSRKRMYQDLMPDRVVSIGTRLGSPALSKRVGSSTLPQTQTTHRSGVFGRLGEQPI